ncbi:hypothetical protein [Pseudomonas sp. SDO55104_S430]
MSMQKLMIGGFLASFGMIQAGYLQAAGTITLWEKDNEIQCSLPAVSQPNGGPIDYSFKNDDQNSCKNDQYYSVSLDNVDSGLIISFFNGQENDRCYRYRWEMEVKTIKQPTTTQKINLSSLWGMPEGAIVEPGVMKLRSIGKGQVHGKLSCVRVERK